MEPLINQIGILLLEVSIIRRGQISLSIHIAKSGFQCFKNDLTAEGVSKGANWCNVFFGILNDKTWADDLVPEVIKNQTLSSIF